MGVRGLKTFIENNDDLLIKDYQLHNTYIIVDACNLIGALMRQSQNHERRDLFGGDMVQFGQYINNFFDNLARCNINPVLVFDGAQTRDVNKSKTTEKKRRAAERFMGVMSVNKVGFGDFVLPATTTNVFRSIASGKKIKIIQCMFEADAEIARLAHELKCPVISNDSDFYLIDLPHGLISIDCLEHERPKCSVDPETGEKFHHYISCSIFYQDHFIKYFPQLDKANLPLLGVLAGNDFIKAKVFESVCAKLPLNIISEKLGMSSRQFRKVTSKQYERILKILYYMSDKTLEQTINQLCQRLPNEKRNDMKKLIKSNLQVYRIPIEDDFKSELDLLYRSGFYKARNYNQGTDSKKRMIEEEFTEILQTIMDWLKNGMEHSVLPYRILELAQRNTVFIQSHMDDPKLPSAHLCQMRALGVILRLLRSSNRDNRPCTFYDRIDETYGPSKVYQIDHLEKFGPLNYLLHDLPRLASDVRIRILLATFHSSPTEFSEKAVEHYSYFEPHHADRFTLIKILLDYIDLEGYGPKLWKEFKVATLLTAIYYYFTKKADMTLASAMEESGLPDFMNDLIALIKQSRYNRMPVLSNKRLYNCRLMHQITQLQTALISYDMLNALLGDVIEHTHSEEWLNSCLVYNLAENLRRKTIRFQNLPSIVQNYISDDT